MIALAIACLFVTTGFLISTIAEAIRFRKRNQERRKMLNFWDNEFRNALQNGRAAWERGDRQALDQYRDQAHLAARRYEREAGN